MDAGNAAGLWPSWAGRGAPLRPARREQVTDALSRAAELLDTPPPAPASPLDAAAAHAALGAAWHAVSRRSRGARGVRHRPCSRCST
jgi:hypothetical protein